MLMFLLFVPIGNVETVSMSQYQVFRQTRRQLPIIIFKKLMHGDHISGVSGLRHIEKCFRARMQWHNYRTESSTERWHCAVKSNVGTFHPSVWSIINTQQNNRKSTAWWQHWSIHWTVVVWLQCELVLSDEHQIINALRICESYGTSS